MKVFVDSSVWIDHFRGLRTADTALFAALLDQLDPRADVAARPIVLVGDLVLLEVLRGIDDDQQYARTRDTLLAFNQVVLGGRRMALLAASHHRSLRRLGVTVRKAVDCLIAAWCIEHAVPLLHCDRDFDPFATHCGLKLFAPGAGSR